MLGVKTAHKIERGVLHLILYSMSTTESKGRGSSFPCGPGSDTADNQHQCLRCSTLSRNTSTYICTPSSQQLFEMGAIFVSICISNYIILFSEVT